MHQSQAIVVLEDCPVGASTMVTMEFGALSLVGLGLHRQIYNVDKSLYTNNLKSFDTLLCQKVNKQGSERAQSSVGVHIFPSAIK